MLSSSRVCAYLVFVILSKAYGSSADNDARYPSFTQQEKALIATFRLRKTPPLDSTNRVEEIPAALRLGRWLFFDARLSRRGNISCATCHNPQRGWSDGRARALGIRGGSRRTPSLWNVAYQRWFFWDGRADSLWSQALEPIENPAEMGGDRLSVVRLIAGDARYAAAYKECFGSLILPEKAEGSRRARPSLQNSSDSLSVEWQKQDVKDRDYITEAYVNVGKAIASFERTIVTSATPFDYFIEALSGDSSSSNGFGEGEKRGLRLFIGKAGCRSCHYGPMLTDGEFHFTRVPPPVDARTQDTGRYHGIALLLASPFNSAGRYSDDAIAGGSKLDGLGQLGQYWGEFKTPSLRNVATRSPYMHAGQFRSLQDVVRFYSTLDNAAEVGHHDEQVLQPLHLSEGEISDIVLFLDSLTERVPSHP